ncbi:MAG: ImmA/IrrE family metallo-endopeptidase [Pseudomonadota bacterium]
MVHKFNDSLMRIARQARGWSQTELSRQSGVSQGYLSKLENGMIDPHDDVVDKLSRTLAFPKTYFFEPDHISGLPVSVHSMYRKKASVGQRAQERLEAEINIRLMHIRRLLKAVEFDRELELPSFELEEFDMEPEQIAALLRRTWEVPSGPLKSLIGWMERAGIIIFHADFDGLAVDGVTVRQPGLPPCVFLNRGQPADRQRFTLAHELGHIIMHRIPSPSMEDEANAFASALLMPVHDIKRALGKKVTIQKLAVLKPVWRVSMNALLYRAKTVGAVTPNQAQYLWRQMSALGYRRAEPPELAFQPEEASILSELLRVHVEDLRYSTEDLCASLHVYEADLKRIHGLPEKSGAPHLRVIK